MSFWLCQEQSFRPVSDPILQQWFAHFNRNAYEKHYQQMINTGAIQSRPPSPQFMEQLLMWRTKTGTQESFAFSLISPVETISYLWMVVFLMACLLTLIWMTISYKKDKMEGRPNRRKNEKLLTLFF